MWLMLQHNTAEDFVIATGKTHSVREFLELALQKLITTLSGKIQDYKKKALMQKMGKRSSALTSVILGQLKLNNYLVMQQRHMKSLVGNQKQPLANW